MGALLRRHCVLAVFGGPTRWRPLPSETHRDAVAAASAGPRRPPAAIGVLGLVEEDRSTPGRRRWWRRGARAGSPVDRLSSRAPGGACRLRSSSCVTRATGRLRGSQRRRACGYCPSRLTACCEVRGLEAARAVAGVAGLEITVARKSVRPVPEVTATSNSCSPEGFATPAVIRERAAGGPPPPRRGDRGDGLAQGVLWAPPRSPAGDT